MNKKIDYTFANSDLYELALTHRSFSSPDSNERLEFLGDAILDLVITEYIYLNYPNLNEGVLAKIRSQIVCGPSLAKVAKDLDLESDIILGKGEKQSSVHTKPSILADTTEALIAAIFLDGGLPAIKPLILDWFSDIIEDSVTSPGKTDYKSRLQELAVKMFDLHPDYEISSEGPDHKKFFHAKVRIENNGSSDFWGEGSGNTKKEATQEAAKQAYEKLKIKSN